MDVVVDDIVLNTVIDPQPDRAVSGCGYIVVRDRIVVGPPDVHPVPGKPMGGYLVPPQVVPFVIEI